MKFRPKFMAYTLGAVPHKNVEDACQAMIRNFSEVLSVPRTTSSLWRWHEGMPCLNIDREKEKITFELSGRESELAEFYERFLAEDLDYFAISPEWDPGIYKLAELLKEKPLPELKFMHFAITGPYTFGFMLKDDKGTPAFYNDTMRDVLTKQLAMKAKWQQRQIKELFPGIDPWYQVGEPGLGVYASASGVGSWDVIKNAINEDIELVGGMTSIHCCDRFDWSLLMDTKTDIISFDTYKYGDTMLLYPDTLKRFLERGGMIAWGIVPTTSSGDVTSETPDNLVERLEGLIQSLVDKGIDRDMLLESSWISPSCSTGSMPVELAEMVWTRTREVSELVKEKYFG